jgi:phytoene dehydrogenase-like protein
MTNAVVVGAGPNGLAAAIHLARNGFDVQLLEAAESVGGGARSGELTVPGVIHDYCSAAHPLGVGSRFWQEIDLGRYGVGWKWPEIDCAHPLDDGTAGVLYQSIEKTTAGLGSDGRRWRLAVGDLVAGFDELGRDVMRPVLHVPRHLIRLAAFGPRAVLPATVAVRWFRTEQARALFGGAAAHMFTRLDQPLTAAMGLMFLASGHRFGWPVAEGGSGSITAALAAALRDHGGAITTGVTVTSRRDIPDADVVMLDLTPAAAVQIYGDSMPGRIKRSYRRYREGSAAFKVDFAIEGHIPWTNPECARAGMVHLGGTFAEIAFTERERAQGRMSERPFTLVGQQYLADPSRSSGNINPIWTYAPCAVRLPGRRHRHHHRPDRAVCTRLPRAHRRHRQQEHRRVAGLQPQLHRRRHHRRRQRPAAGRVPAPGGDRSLLHRRARRLSVLAIHAARRRYPRAVRLSRRPVGVAPAGQVSQQPNRRDRPRFAAYSRSY